MFVVCRRKMQKVRCLCGLFSLVVLLLSNWLITNINAYPTQLINPWKNKTEPPPISKLLRKTSRKTSSGISISYRLNSWSQYDNPEEGIKREGDIHLSSKSRKTITADKTLLWPNGIVNYYVDSSIVNEPSKLAMLKDALHTIMSRTCIKFIRIKKYENLPANNWINITGHQKGCFSDLGRNAYGYTTLNLDVNACFRTVGHSMHEIMHTLGVYHEHMRPDRDKYITIIWENIRKEVTFNFHILNNSIVTDYGLPYDYDSVMHYSMTAFSTDKSLPTIIPRTPYVEIGQRSHLSYHDTLKLLISYNCSTIKVNTKKKRYLVKFKSTRRSLPQQNKIITEPKVKSQTPFIIIHNSIPHNLDKYIDLIRSMNEFQTTFYKSMYSVQPNYHPIPLNPIYPYINFPFYLRKK